MDTHYLIKRKCDNNCRQGWNFDFLSLGASKLIGIITAVVQLRSLLNPRKQNSIIYKNVIFDDFY